MFLSSRGHIPIASCSTTIVHAFFLGRHASRKKSRSWHKFNYDTKLNYRNGSSMIGIGYTGEGLADSYFTTDLLFEMAYRPEPVADLHEWTRGYVTRRYGDSSDALVSGWQGLLAHVFNSSDMFHHRKFLVARMPSLKWREPVPSHLPDVARGLDGLINSATKLGHNPGFRYDTKYEKLAQ